MLCSDATEEEIAVEACTAEEANDKSDVTTCCSSATSCSTSATVAGSLAKKAGEARILLSVCIASVLASENEP